MKERDFHDFSRRKFRLLFHKADTVIQMKQYLPVEITDFAKKEAEQFPLVLEHIAEAKLPSFERIVKRDVAFQKENRIKMKALGKEAVSVNREEGGSASGRTTYRP